MTNPTPPEPTPGLDPLTKAGVSIACLFAVGLVIGVGWQFGLIPAAAAGLILSCAGVGWARSQAATARGQALLADAPPKQWTVATSQTPPAADPQPTAWPVPASEYSDDSRP